MKFYEYFYILFVPILYNMQHEIAIVKKAVKKYKTKNDGVKESISKRIDLGAKSGFDDADKVAIIPIADFNKINEIDVDEITAENNANNERIIELNETLQNKDNEINDLTDKIAIYEKQIADLESDISKKDDKISGLENKIIIYDEIDVDDLQKKSKELDKSKNIIIKLQNEKNEYIQLIGFKDRTIDALRNKGLWDTLLKKDVTTDIDKPPLKLIDSSGYAINKDDIETNATSESGSEKNV